MRLFVAVIGLSLAVATAVSAQTAAESSAPAGAPPAEKKKEGIVCHREIPTGSQFPVKVCTTAEQRKAQRGSTQHAQETMQGASQTVPN